MGENLSVAIVELVGGHGGMNHYDVGLCKGLLSSGVRVSFYTCDETADLDVAGLHFCPVYKGIFGKSNQMVRGFRFLAGSLAVAWSAIRHNEVVVHLHVFQSGIPELILVLLMKLCSRKVVVTVHDVESLAEPAATGKRLSQVVFRLADCLIVHNESSKRELTRHLKLGPARIKVIPHGNYLDAISNTPDAAEAKRSLEIGETKKVVLFFGQIKDVKGLDLLIEALPAVIREIPEVILVIAGQPWKTDFSQYDSLIDKLGIRDHCRIKLGYVPDDRVSQYYAAADVVVLPYRRIYQSGVLLLAMSYGKAVIASDLPGMTDIVSNGENGYLFAGGSAWSLSNTLVHVLQEDCERKEIAARAYRFVQDHHDWTRIGLITAQLYRTVLAGSRHAAM